jgi:hypothetical protein
MARGRGDSDGFQEKDSQQDLLQVFGNLGYADECCEPAADRDHPD